MRRVLLEIAVVVGFCLIWLGIDQNAAWIAFSGGFVFGSFLVIGLLAT